MKREVVLRYCTIIIKIVSFHCVFGHTTVRTSLAGNHMSYDFIIEIRYRSGLQSPDFFWLGELSLSPWKDSGIKSEKVRKLGLGNYCICERDISTAAAVVVVLAATTAAVGFFQRHQRFYILAALAAPDSPVRVFSVRSVF